MESLPVDLIKEIKYFYQLPEIDILIEKSGGEHVRTLFYFSIKYQILTINLEMVPPLLENGIVGGVWQYRRENRGLIELNQFIEDLFNNKDSSYEEVSDIWGIDNYFGIELINNTIKINGGNVKIDLTIESKNRVLEAMKKYRDILNTY